MICAQTCFTRVESGEVVVKLKGVEIVRVSAAGDITLDTGGSKRVRSSTVRSLVFDCVYSLMHLSCCVRNGYNSLACTKTYETLILPPWERIERAS